MNRVRSHIIGVGGVFLRSEDRKEAQNWYGDFLGISFNDTGGHDFFWRRSDEPDTHSRTVLGFFDADSRYFDGPVMVNYIVRDLDGLLSKLRARGMTEAKPPEQFPYGKFAWIKDLEDRWIELWEPVPDAPENTPPAD